jgi:hypothetical protein
MPITQAANIQYAPDAAVAAAERVFELLDEVEEPEDASDAKITGPRPKGRSRIQATSPSAMILVSPFLKNVDI